MNKLKDYYSILDNLISKKVIVDAYGGDDADGEILCDFYELFCKFPEEETPIWAESYIQLYSWQFQNYHEGLDGYYDNFYGHTSHTNINRAGIYIKDIGYYEVAEYLLMAVHTLAWDEMTEKEKELY